MPRVEITVPDQLVSEIDRLVESGEFVNREEAMEELLGFGLSAMAGSGPSEETPGENPFSQVIEDQQDPAMLDEGDDGYAF
ncbi:MAG: ribbon-helix-helix protein, CopG family [Actinobacteria bacterium]|nr:ribbon-helix-helix protein, CopG family [Actinomycetota bacterium]NIU65085.1 ribbon-helix-helix protein, CopG family [Actinomycetota bacterium]NIV86153.1 ribbon-helix-helix protein, CopG family [Actinomycetota bacterium]NIW26886.1 ribbon-helix-helix protein, CopG family [Actinomycetota bacterium]NIX19441.1 ribbon-helix-helix protein, CopG family [Actinomycetota bacterium]